MISVLLYGRNDGYGYNLAKRTALGLNCLAEMLTHSGDEIHFVDCNTQDTFATLPESIADTLTARAKRLLRIWRFRPSHYAKYRGDTKLPLLEPICRNIALRRSNPRNRWVLSSNPDMIFAPKRRFDSLSKIAARAADGFYELPRFELPEFVWEGWNRSDPRAAIKAARRAGDELRLNYIVHTSEFCRFSGLGDFQLVLKSQMEAIGGFDESMLNGWHVDTNLAKRLWLLNGETKSLDAELAGYHCGHLRQALAIHTSETTQNSYDHHVERVFSPHLSDQMQTWGLPDEEFEEIRLDRPKQTMWFDHSAHSLQGKTLAMTVNMSQHWHDVETALTHLANEWQHLPRSLRIGYVGITEGMRDSLAQLIQKMGFTSPLAVAWAGQGIESLVRDCDLILLDADLTPVSADLKEKHRKLTTLRNPDKEVGQVARDHLEVIRGWLADAATAARTAPGTKRFYLRGLSMSPLRETALKDYVLTTAAPALGFLPAQVRPIV